MPLPTAVARSSPPRLLGGTGLPVLRRPPLPGTSSSLRARRLGSRLSAGTVGYTAERTTPALPPSRPPETAPDPLAHARPLAPNGARPSTTQHPPKPDRPPSHRRATAITRSCDPPEAALHDTPHTRTTPTANAHPAPRLPSAPRCGRPVDRRTLHRYGNAPRGIPPRPGDPSLSRRPAPAGGRVGRAGTAGPVDPNDHPDLPAELQRGESSRPASVRHTQLGRLWYVTALLLLGDAPMASASGACAAPRWDEALMSKMRP
jgi:hypothetical protein